MYKECTGLSGIENVFICALPSCCDIGHLCFKDNIIDTRSP